MNSHYQPERSPVIYRPTPQRMQWWLEARLGISFHWGVYSIPARGEWVRSNQRMSIEQYQTYVDSLNPDRYDAHTWAKLARQAGMKYAILTTKHHDGFCLFDSKLTDYKATRCPAGRDLVREYVDAFRDEGLRVGLYYSLVDWHHPDYPAYGDRQHPMRHDPSHKDRSHNWSGYVQYLHGQVRELLTHYGVIDLLIFDFSYWDFVGEKWGADDLVKMIRQLQPNIVLNDRLTNGYHGSIKEANPAPWAGDFDTCELNTPTAPTCNANGEIVPWDLWITHNNSWGYSSSDKAYKSSADIIRALVNCVSKSGNLTVNFSPTARGELPSESMRVLEEIGHWMSANGESIYGCGIADFERPDWGRFTSDGKTLYAHIMEQPMGNLTLPGLRGKVRRPRLLATGAEAFIRDFWNPGVQTFGQPNDIFFNLYQPTAHTYLMPDPIDTVVAMELVPENQQVEEARLQTWQPGPRVPFL